MTGALAGVRVIDFGHYIAGPLAAVMLSVVVLMPLAFFDWMVIEEVEVSLKFSFSLSPRRRLMPLNEASSANLSSWSRSSSKTSTSRTRTAGR